MENQMKTTGLQRGFELLGGMLVLLIRGITASVVLPTIFIGIFGVTIVVAICGIIAALAVPKIISLSDEAELLAEKQEITDLIQV
jgi:type II secretory pathway pseudopilin PulG